MDPLARLITELSKLPGIGEKTAIRLAYHLLKQDLMEINSLAEAIREAKLKIKLCSLCFSFTENDICKYCSDAQRKENIFCVVEKPADVLAIENSQRYFGRYHVLHGVISPLDGVGPEQLKLKELLVRLQNHSSQSLDSSDKEVILALNPTVEGEATGVYLSRLLKPLGVKVSRIAHGIPVGGVLEYVDRQTIGRALENRQTTV